MKRIVCMFGALLLLTSAASAQPTVAYDIQDLGNGYDLITVRSVATTDGDIPACIQANFTPLNGTQLYQEPVTSVYKTPYDNSGGYLPPPPENDTHFLFNTSYLGVIVDAAQEGPDHLNLYATIRQDQKKAVFPFAQFVLEEGDEVFLDGVFANGQGNKGEFNAVLPSAGQTLRDGWCELETFEDEIDGMKRIQLYVKSLDESGQLATNVYDLISAFDGEFRSHNGSVFHQVDGVFEQVTPLEDVGFEPSPELDSHFAFARHEIGFVFDQPDEDKEGNFLSGGFIVGEAHRESTMDLAQLVVPHGQQALAEISLWRQADYQEFGFEEGMGHSVSMVVPEPASLALLAGAGLMAVRRRR